MTHSKAEMQTGKRPLTEDNINRSIPQDTRSKDFRDLAQAAQLDLKGLLSKQFALTQNQLKGLNALSKEELDKVRAALAEAQKTGVSLKVKLVPLGKVPGKNPFVQVVRETAPSSDNAKPEFNIIKIEIHGNC